jgi:hypothetical protein
VSIPKPAEQNPTAPPRTPFLSPSGSSTPPIVIRAIRTDDKQALRDGADWLSERSRYRRSLSLHSSLTPAELAYFPDVDHHDHGALVAIDPTTGEGIGVARTVSGRRILAATPD